DRRVRNTGSTRLTNGFTLGMDGLRATSSLAGRSLEDRVDLPPEDKPLIPLLNGQLLHRDRLAHPGQVRVRQPSRQLATYEKTGCPRAAVKRFGPNRQVGV